MTRLEQHEAGIAGLFAKVYVTPVALLHGMEDRRMLGQPGRAAGLIGL